MGEPEAWPITNETTWSTLDTGQPHSARMYNYWLGGKDNFAADRDAAEAVAQMFPSIRTAAIENRKFLCRAVTLLAGQLGVRQFLDIGTGLPSARNTHQVAQSVAPQSRVVYVDNDPLVMVHARALLRSDPGFGVTDYIEADLRKPETILQEAARTLNLDQPVALMLVAVLHFLCDDDDPYGVVARLIDALAPGSYLVLSHATGDHVTQDVITRAAAGPVPVWLRTHDQVTRFFPGLQLLPPHLVAASQWRAADEPQPRPTAEQIGVYSAVARIR